jgi:hypothetical protein
LYCPSYSDVPDGSSATYDPTSHYRAAAVFAFHDRQALGPAFLREVSRHQVGLLKAGFESLDVDPAVAGVEPMPDDRRAGFLAIRSPHAGALCDALRQRGVHTDFRRDVLRLGPAPYLSDDQLREAIARLGEALRATTIGRGFSPAVGADLQVRPTCATPAGVRPPVLTPRTAPANDRGHSGVHSSCC